jgi:hypothetical protein
MKIPIRDFPNYLVTDSGDIISLHTGKLLKFDIGPKFYCRVTLCKNGKTSRFLVHRIVAQHFIPNPNKKRTVNHIDGDPTNNQVSNLEWATHSENHLHAFRELGKKANLTGLGRKNELHASSKIVYKFNRKTGEFICSYPSVNEASRSHPKIDSKNISAACLGKIKSCGGFQWSYSKEKRNGL